MKRKRGRKKQPRQTRVLPAKRLDVVRGGADPNVDKYEPIDPDNL